MRPMRVLFVSKPIAPPYHDGTRCLVRDLTTHMRRARPTVLTTQDAPPPGPGVEIERVYDAAGSFAPQLVDNARVLKRLLLGSRHDIWHFVFAPNPPSSMAARVAVLARRVPTVQTVASVPRTFEGSARLLFGHRVVCQSRSTRDRLVAAGADPARLEVILSPLVPPEPITPEARSDALARIGLQGNHGPVLVYPGDLEFSSGARTVAQSAAGLLRAHPDARLVFACRAKTPRAQAVAAQLQQSLAEHGDRVLFAGHVPSLPALMAACRLVLFPVDDLYGKVDIPLSLLEAQALGVPVVALQLGPLCELEGAIPLPSPGQLADVCSEVLRDDAAWQQHRDLGLAAVARNHDPDRAAAAYEDVYGRTG